MEMTLPELLQATEQAFPDTQKRQNATSDVRVDGISFVPTDGGLLIKGTVVNTNKGSKYETSVLFEQVNYTNENDRNAVELKGPDNSAFFIEPLDVNKIDAKVSCTCMDFHFRFALWNYSKGTLLGQKPEPYQRKTDSRPEANPKHSPGVCKHLIKTIEEIQNNQLV